jgi:hypothetical protein
MMMDRRTWLRMIAGGLISAAATRDPRSLGDWPLLGSSQAQRRTVLGINSHLLTPEAIAKLRDLGITHVRHTLYWPMFEEHPDYPFGFRQDIARAHAAGLRLTVVVHNWFGPDTAVVHNRVDLAMMRRFAAFVAARAAEFPQVEAWQLWNEQDLWVQAPFGAGVGVPMYERGQNYARQLELAYPAIRKASPDALIVSGGLADHPDSGFLEGMLASRPPVDAIAVHGYGSWAEIRERALAARRLAAGHAPIWLTEAGMDAADDQRQLAAWRGIVEGNERERLAVRLYPYVLLSGVTEPGFGLFRRDGRTPRATYHWLRRHVRG